MVTVFLPSYSESKGFKDIAQSYSESKGFKDIAHNKREKRPSI
jgi:hypothetical protein